MRAPMIRGPIYSRQSVTIFGGTMAIVVLILVAQIYVAHSALYNQQQNYPSSRASKMVSTGNFVATLSRPARHVHEESRKIIDLSYQLNSKTLHWPANTGFNYSVERDAQVDNPASGKAYHLKSDSFCTAIHTGTHLDAPLHFSAGGWTVEQIPLDRLIDVPLTVIDLSETVKKNRTYTFLKRDFVDKKSDKPLVKANSVVLVYTGISNYYNQGAKAYFGTDSKNISEMSIPGFSLEAANFLVAQKVYGVGLDAPSADSSVRHGANNSYDPQAHVAFNSNNIYILENINGNLSQLVNSTSARLTIAPLPIENGSGSPVRVIAITGHDESACHARNSAQTGSSQLNLTVLVSLLLGVVALIL